MLLKGFTLVLRWESEGELGLLYVAVTQLHTGSIPVLLFHTNTHTITHPDAVSCTKGLKSSLDLHIPAIFFFTVNAVKMDRHEDGAL